MKKQLVNSALQIFSTFDKWDAFIDLVEIRANIQQVWVENAKSRIKDEFKSNEVWKMEYGGWWDVRWHLISQSSVQMNYWLSQDSAFHFVIHNDGTKGELIKNIFDKPKFESLKYVWGTDVITNFNFEIKVKQEGKWNFDCEYDNDLRTDRLIWFAGNETEKFIRQIAEKVLKFQKPDIVALLRELQSEIESALSL